MDSRAPRRYGGGGREVGFHPPFRVPSFVVLFWSLESQEKILGTTGVASRAPLPFTALSKRRLETLRNKPSDPRLKRPPARRPSRHARPRRRLLGAAGGGALCGSVSSGLGLGLGSRRPAPALPLANGLAGLARRQVRPCRVPVQVQAGRPTGSRGPRRPRRPPRPPAPGPPAAPAGASRRQWGRRGGLKDVSAPRPSKARSACATRPKVSAEAPTVVSPFLPPFRPAPPLLLLARLRRRGSRGLEG